MSDPLLTCDDVAELLGVSSAWVQREARAGRIDHRKIGRSYRFTHADVDTLIYRSLVVGDDPFARTPRQLAALNRTRPKGPAPRPRQLGPFDVPGIPEGALPDPLRVPTARIVCPGTGQRVTANSYGGGTCPHCGRSYSKVFKDQPGDKDGRMSRHILYIPRSELTDDHRLWPGGRQENPGA